MNLEKELAEFAEAMGFIEANRKHFDRGFEHAVETHSGLQNILMNCSESSRVKLTAHLRDIYKAGAVGLLALQAAKKQATADPHAELKSVLGTAKSLMAVLRELKAMGPDAQRQVTGIDDPEEIEGLDLTAPDGHQLEEINVFNAKTKKTVRIKCEGKSPAELKAAIRAVMTGETA